MQWPRLTTLAKTEGLRGRIITLWANCIDPQETSSTILVRPLMLWLFLRGRHGVMASSSYQFSQHSLRSVGSFEYTSAAKAFIFSLHNVHGYKPVKLAQYRYQGYVIYHCNSYRPTFEGYQGRHDIQLRNNAGNIHDSFTTCGSTYAVPTGYPAFAKCVFFSGSELFTPTDLEVFYEMTS